MGGKLPTLNCDDDDFFKFQISYRLLRNNLKHMGVINTTTCGQNITTMGIETMFSRVVPRKTCKYLIFMIIYLPA